jgi:hypothetical protein
MKVVASYIVSPQQTAGTEPNKLNNITVVSSDTNLLKVIEPSWKEYIPLNQLRRMGKAVRIGTGAGLKLIEDNPTFKEADAIILSSANGGLEDCIKFLKQIIEYGDGALTPTNFVQSTPNAISGSIAMATGNHAYNMTHVNSSFSFVDGLRDAELLLGEMNSAKVLLGSVEEISEYNYNINTLRGDYKTSPINSLELLSSNSPGTICGEGAAFFGITSGEPSQEDGFNIVGFDTLFSSESKNIHDFIQNFLSTINISADEIDTVMLGYSGDIDSDGIYDEIVENLFTESNVCAFKHLFGEHPSVISMGFWYSSLLLRNENPFTPFKIDKDRESKYILIFNQYNSTENSIIIVSK